MKTKLLLLVILVLLLAGCGGTTAKNEPSKGKAEVILATTTSTQDSGLLDVLIPMFEQKTGYKVKTIAVGTGQALAMGEKGEADVLLVHAPDAERKVMAGGAAVNRRLVMHNDFILVGSATDHAGSKGLKIRDGLTAIAKEQQAFISRGDQSGTHQLEKKLWALADIKPAGSWYQEAGAGMGQTLKIADEKKGYTLSDRATYLAQKRNLSLVILIESDSKLLNLYHVMEVNGGKFAKVNQAGAKAFSDFLLEPATQMVIANFGKDKFGQALFYADGGKTEQDFGQ